MVALERRDGEMGFSAHSARVALLADRIPTLLDLDEPLRALLRHTALIHEVGMIGVPAELIRKRGSLTPDELAQIHHHAATGAAVAEATRARTSRRSPATRRNLLRAGAGSRFDPAAADAYLSTAA
jgi:HD-GYP domain-containing protein (c-di-GMP phosphodiesterase class II)